MADAYGKYNQTTAWLRKGAGYLFRIPSLDWTLPHQPLHTHILYGLGIQFQKTLHVQILEAHGAPLEAAIMIPG